MQTRVLEELVSQLRQDIAQNTTAFKVHTHTYNAWPCLRRRPVLPLVKYGLREEGRRVSDGGRRVELGYPGINLFYEEPGTSIMHEREMGKKFP